MIEILRRAVNAACTCGGAGPGDGCPACEVWHYVQDRLKMNKTGHRMDDLGPYFAKCPFCGEIEDFSVTRGPETTGFIPAQVGCNSCGASGPWGFVRDPGEYERAAAKEWNRRAHND